MIVDAHAHIFKRMSGEIEGGKVRSAGYGRVRVDNGDVIQLIPPLLQETTFPPDVLIECMDWAGVDKAVLLQGPFYGERNEEVAEAVHQWPTRFAGAGLIDPWSPDARSLFERIVRQHQFGVLKLELSTAFGLSGLHANLRLDDDYVGWLWAELERRHIVLVLDLGAVGSASYQTAAVARLSDSHPDLKIVIAHLGQPTPAAENDPGLWQMWDRQIGLGLRPQIWFDTSALPHRASPEPYPFPSIGRWIKRAIDLVGPHKLMWGTDAPALLTAANYNQLLTLMQRHCEFLAPADRDLVFGTTALEVFPFT